MRASRKIILGAATLVGIGLAAASTAEAQVCQHIGKWTRVGDGWVCSGDYTSGHCTWTDDCRVNAE
ncbi:MAG TPA: hypothetical protein VK358_19570 [Longimicrobium sp.]|nr:hypothetical protein [Longimicrobium sp.]